MLGGPFDTPHLLNILLGYRWLDLHLWTPIALHTSGRHKSGGVFYFIRKLAAFIQTPVLSAVLAHGRLAQVYAAYAILAGSTIIAGQALGETARIWRHYVAYDPDPLRRVDVHAVFMTAFQVNGRIK